MLRLREDADRQHLGEAADLYWKAARWCDAVALAPFLTEPADQLLVARTCATPREKITDARILQAVVGEELLAPRLRKYADLTQRWRTGTVLVQVESYGLNSDRLQTTTVEQPWVLDPRGWHVDPTVTPITPDHPW